MIRGVVEFIEIPEWAFQLCRGIRWGRSSFRDLWTFTGIHQGLCPLIPLVWEVPLWAFWGFSGLGESASGCFQALWRITGTARINTTDTIIQQNARWGLWRITAKKYLAMIDPSDELHGLQWSQSFSSALNQIQVSKETILPVRPW